MGAYSAWAWGQHRQNLAQRPFHLARQTWVQPHLCQAGGRHQRIGLALAEHERGQLKPRPQAVPHTGLALNGHALVLQVGHIAVNRALRDFQPLRQERRRRQPPPPDELNDLEQAVSAAHICNQKQCWRL